MPKISIIMPTYNVENYFRECIESVINQTLTDIEIIPVDDGSPDNCGKIMDEYAAKDSRIKPIHKSNGGYGSAVNAGIDAATGEYIGIVETDDMIHPTMYEKLYNQAKQHNLDVCKCGFNTFNSNLPKSLQIKPWLQNNDKYITQNIKIFSPDKVFTIFDDPRLLIYHASIWSNIYRKEFLIKNNIRVNATQSASYQDFPFMVEVMLKAKSIGIVPENLYNWRREFGMGSSTERNDSRLLIMAEQCENVKTILKNNNVYENEQIKEYIYYHFYLANIGFYLSIQPKYQREYFDRLHNLFKELKNDANFKYKLFNKKEKLFVQKCINNSYWSCTFKILLKKYRKNLIRFRNSHEEKYLIIFNKTIYKINRKENIKDLA